MRTLKADEASPHCRMVSWSRKEEREKLFERGKNSAHCSLLQPLTSHGWGWPRIRGSLGKSGLSPRFQLFLLPWQYFTFSPPYWEAVNITLGFYGVMLPLQQQQQLWTTCLGKIEKWDHQFSLFSDSNFFEVKQFLKADVIFLSVLRALEATTMIKNIFLNSFYLLLSWCWPLLLG